jgi:AmmeMemoRadiSam system protein B
VNGVRHPVAAGRFYPADGNELAALVDGLLDAAPPPPGGRLRALLAPHAGYVYSGAVAAAAYAAIAAGTRDLRVALLGPSHFAPLDGAAATGAAAWRTPLGSVPVDRELCAAALEAGAVTDDRPHRADHALEVQLPFLQRRAGPGLRIAPIAVGESAGGAELVAVLAQTALVVVSSDLSHYHDEATARSIDARTAAAVLALDDAAVGEDDACGAHAFRALLRHARRCGWGATQLALRTSADATGDRRHVVGYGAFAFSVAE